MQISIIIVNYRSWEPLKRCLDSLKSMNKAPFSWEAIIVDNFSNDHKLVNFREKYPEFLFIENDGNYGFSNGNNLGARQATGEYLLFLNADTIPNADTLKGMLALAEKYKDKSVVSAQQTDFKGRNENPFDIFPSFFTINGIIKSIYIRITGKNRIFKCAENDVIFPDWVSGSLIMIQSTFFRKIGGWCEDFWLYTEDAELCRRASDYGGTVVLQCQPPIIHQHGGTTRRNVRVAAFCKAHVIISKHIYFRKYYKGFPHASVQTFLILNTLIFSHLIPALLGLLIFFNNDLRKYLLTYFYLLKYYFSAIRKYSWYIDSKSVELPG